MIAISESTPGPIAINSATYIGYKVAGVVGSLFATLGVIIPSFTIIFIISLFFNQFLELKYVGYAFKGIQVCVIYLILSAGFKLMKELEKNLLNFTIMFIVIVAMLLCSVFAVNFSSVFYILICGTIGLIIYLISGIRKKGCGNK